MVRFVPLFQACSFLTHREALVECCLFRVHLGVRSLFSLWLLSWSHFASYFKHSLFIFPSGAVSRTPYGLSRVLFLIPTFTDAFPSSSPWCHGYGQHPNHIVTSGALRSYYLIRKTSGRIFYIIHALLFCNHHQTANRSLTGNVEATKHVK